MRLPAGQTVQLIGVAWSSDLVDLVAAITVAVDSAALRRCESKR
jgi:hypothetical protein